MADGASAPAAASPREAAAVQGVPRLPAEFYEPLESFDAVRRAPAHFARRGARVCPPRVACSRRARAARRCATSSSSYPSR